MRAVKYWNELPAFVVTGPSGNAFKKRLKKVVRRRLKEESGILGFTVDCRF